nr:unnamed protein product [Spirometra erinaceieuropaei]
MYKAVVLTSILYGTETWTVYSSKTRKLSHFLSQSPSQNTEAEMAEQDPGHGSPTKDRQIQYQRHAEATVAAMEQPSGGDGRRTLPKQLYCGYVAAGARRQAGQKRCYKDTLKNSLKPLQINTETWEDLAQDRPAWRWAVETGAAIQKANCIAAVKTENTAHKL